MRSYLHLLVLAGPIVACGGQVFLDNASTSSGKVDSGTGANLDSGLPVDDASTTSPLCGSTPEAIATLSGDLNFVDTIAVNNTDLVYTASNVLAPEPKDPLRRALHAVKLDAGSDKLLVTDNPLIEAISASISLIGDQVYYTSGTTLPQDGYGPREVKRIALSGGSPTNPFLPGANKSYDAVTAAPNGVLYGTAHFEIGMPPQDVWWSWTEGSTSESAFPAPSDLAHLTAFDGGFAAIDSSSDNVHVALSATKGVSIGHATSNGRKVKKVRTFRETASEFLALYVLEGPGNDLGLPEERIIQSDCVIDVGSGIKACPEGVRSPVYSVVDGKLLNDFQIREDRTLVVAQTATDGIRPASQIVWVSGGKAEPIGGEGVTGTVDRITALATRGSCIYWAEQGTAGSRIMRVRR